MKCSQILSVCLFLLLAGCGHSDREKSRGGKWHLQSVNLTNADLSYLNLGHVNLSHSKLVNSNLTKTNLSDSMVVNVNFHGWTSIMVIVPTVGSTLIENPLFKHLPRLNRWLRKKRVKKWQLLKRKVSDQVLSIITWTFRPSFWWTSARRIGRVLNLDQFAR